MLDFFILLQDWGACPTFPLECLSDLNKDGGVDVNDFFALLQNWGNAGSGGSGGGGTGDSGGLQQLIEFYHSLPVFYRPGSTAPPLPWESPS